MNLTEQLNGEWKVAEFKAYKYSDDKNPESESQSFLINTAEFKEEYKVKFEKPDSEDKNKILRYIGYDDEKVSIKILLDETGVLDYSDKKNIKKSLDSFKKNQEPKSSEIFDKIKSFKDLYLTPTKDTHMPRILEITWGNFHFKCHVESLSIDYKLFDKQGNPIRAELTLGLLRKKKIKNPESPDMTHVRHIKAGDNIQLMTHEIYRDAKFYWHLARENKLIHFRKLNAGEKIFFPPLRKI